MAFLLKCKCGRTYRVPSEKRGRRLRCKKCNRVTIVTPKPEVDLDPPPATPLPSAMPIPPATPLPRATTKKATKKTKPESEDDWFVNLPEEPSEGHGPVRESPRLPPRVITGKKEIEADDVPERRRPRAAQAGPASEFLAPVLVAVVGLAFTVATSFALKPEAIPVGLWLGFRMAMIAASLVITFGALFLASMVVEADYGYISTGLIKVTAIVLTQDWVGDLASRIPIPFVGGLVAFLTTYAMFKYFFGLDDSEAIASMFVVRIVHWVVFSVMFFAALSYVLAGNNIEIPGLGGLGDDGPAIEVPADGADFDEPEGEVMDADGAEP